MKITKQQLIEMGACPEFLNRFIEQTNNTDDPIDVSSLIGGLNTYSDLLWLAGKTLHKERIVRFACDCALINIDKIEPYADKYDEIVAFLHNPNADADDAVYAADAVSAYAVLAAYAAYAVLAAYAADAVFAASYAVYSAAAAARADDAQVNSLLLEMLEELDK